MAGREDEGIGAGGSEGSMEPEPTRRPRPKRSGAKKPDRTKTKGAPASKKPGKRPAEPGPVSVPGELDDGDLHGHGPLPKQTVELSSVDHTDKSCQLRVGKTSRTKLARSLRQHGQLNPIKVYPGDNGYIIIDGHSRVEELRKMGRTTVDVIIYPVMTTAEARRLAFEFNVVRNNLTATDKGSIVLAAQKEGISYEVTAETYGIPLRTVQRYASIPEVILKHFDGETLTYTQCKALAEVLAGLPEGELERILARIRKERLSGPQLRSILRDKGFLKTGQGRPSALGLVHRDRIVLRAAKVERTASIEEIRSLRDLTKRLAKWADDVLDDLEGAEAPPDDEVS